MIISCPECTTRYDVEDERFSPDGRSVRCTACGEAWFVPAPEPIDVDPIEDLTPAKRVPQSANRGNPDRDGGVAKGDFEEEEDDSLFGSPSNGAVDSAEEGRTAEEDVEQDKGRIGFPGFGFGGRRSGGANRSDEDNDADRSHDIDDRAPPFIKHKSRKEREDRELRNARENIVDADWEDVDHNASGKPRQRDDHTAAPETAPAEKAKTGGDRRFGFGRRATDATESGAEEHGERRAEGSAIARLEDVSPFDPEEFDEEFFTSLKVTPKALARALKKTRRRAESRQKNRLTPFRALGWTIWLAAVVGAAYGVVAYRDEIVKIAPKTADAYAIVGIEANPFGLAIENVEHRLAMSTAGPTIEISGKLKNKGDKPVAAPLLQAEALGSRGELLSRWTFSPTDPEVLEGATIDFITRAPAPDGVAEVALSFAPTKSPVSELLSGRE